MKFLVPNKSFLQNPWLGGYHPQIHILSVLNWICWTPPKKKSWVRHCEEMLVSDSSDSSVLLVKPRYCSIRRHDGPCPLPLPSSSHSTQYTHSAHYCELLYVNYKYAKNVCFPYMSEGYVLCCFRTEQPHWRALWCTCALSSEPNLLRAIRILKNVCRTGLYEYSLEADVTGRCP